jgi:alpha-mannosidase
VANNSISIIKRTIAKLRQLVQQEVQHSWHDLTLLKIVNLSSNLTTVKLQECPVATVNEKGYIVFPSGKQIKLLAQQIIIPSTLQNYQLAGLSLRLVLTWWAEDAQIFINGKLVQQGDLFDSSARVLITADAQPGQEYLVTIRLVSPNHDIGALMRSHLIYEQLDNSLDSPQNIDPGLVADELTVLLKYISQFEPEHLERLAAELDRFNWRNSNNCQFVEDLKQLRSRLLPLAKNIKQRHFNLLGHAHLDMAWLWTTDETYEVAERTFKSVLSLQQDFPDLVFGHTSPALYQWIENNRPELFKLIQAAVKADKWEILGGMWIEPETNLVCGESLIRQLLYGQEYYQEKFGKITQIAWLPDSFGFTWQLPQIFQQCGIKYFVTGKLHWNDTTKFPHGCFWWESPDGTRLLTLMSPPNITGVMDTNPLTMSNYAADWETQTGLQDIFWLPGVGDHGGGPTKDMLEVAQKWNKSPFFPEIKFSTARNYLDNLAQRRLSRLVWGKDAEESQDRFPVWQDELYLELHRGCFTVHAEQKKYNRRCERLLYEAELWSTLASLLCGDNFDSKPLFSNIKTIVEKEGFCQADPRKLIEIAWKKVLFNQFHDILPGTSIPEVFIEANQSWQEAIALGENLLGNALGAIASNINLPQPPQPDAQPLVVFNSLNWQRSDLVTIEAEFSVYDCQGKAIDSQLTNDNKLIFLAQNIPSVGYQLFWLCPKSLLKKTLLPQQYILENQYLKVIVNSDNGDLDSIFDKINQQKILSQPGKLQTFSDKGQYWDAWNIDPDYEQKQLSEPKLQSIEWLENGKLRQIIRVTKQFNQSKFIQDYILETNSPLLKIANQVDWQETHVLLKVAFPLTIESDRVTYEIPCGTITRTTQPKTVAEKAKWEVPALNWADLTTPDGKYGVSLLNDGKYGYDAQSNQLRLTLLRSPVWPDPQSDRGIHDFTYAIYPHQGGWREANTVQKGYELNTPLQTILLEQYQPNSPALNSLPPTSKLLNLSANNLVLMALKLSTEGELIMRCYEAHGLEAKINLQSDLDLELATSLDCLERENSSEERLKQIEPCKILTFKLNKIV